MSAFEFFFSFYGLILGLSVAEVITGLVRVFKQRQRVRIGWLTPMLGLFVLLDIASFWTGAWRLMQGIEISYGLLVLGLAIATIYFAAASMVTPDSVEEWPDFDAFYDRHKAYVLTGIIVANLLAFEGVQIVLDLDRWVSGLRDVAGWVERLLYTLPMVAPIVVRDRRANIGLLVILIGVYISSAFMS